MGETGAVVVQLTGIIYMLKKIINIISSFAWPKEPLKQWSPKKVCQNSNILFGNILGQHITSLD